MVEFKKGEVDNLVSVCFSCRAPAGQKVFLAGVFNDWDYERARMIYSESESDAAYTYTLDLPAGTYEYKFVVNGMWVLDEGNSSFVSNDFGTLNSIVTVK